MPVRPPRRSLIRLARAGLFFAVLAAPALSFSADAFPKLRYGEWEFTRSVPGQAANVQSLSMRECLDPGRSMRDQNAMLEKVGCKFDPPQVAGKVYTYVARCDVPDVGKTVARSVLTVESDSAYTISVESEGVMQGKPVKSAETMTAKRLGNCKKK